MDFKKIYLVSPRGFCAGVRRALDIVEKVIAVCGCPVYVLHEIVHNDYVVNDLRGRGVIFIENLDDAPCGSTVVFSAHGVSKAIEKQALERGFKCIDAACPLVKKIHNKAVHYENENYELILIGHRDHPEIKGTLGQLSKPAIVIENIRELKKLYSVGTHKKIAYLTQTTFSVSETEEIVKTLKEIYPDIEGAGDICYATQNRQNAVKLLAKHCDTILIVGSPKSSNSCRMREIAASEGISAYLINSPSELSSEILQNARSIGISAGASAPECLVRELVDFLRQKGWNSVSELVFAEEKTSFSMPSIKP